MKNNNNQLKKVTYIIGPTAIGKSELAIKLAQTYSAEIISADAYQVYKEMTIGTAKVSAKQQSLIKHHLIDTHAPDDVYDVIQFLDYTKKYLAQAQKNNQHTIICGGNGLFLRSFIYNYQFPNAKSDSKIRQQLEIDYDQLGRDRLWERLNDIDSQSAKKIHPNNRHHLIRALEITQLTGKPPSSIKMQSETQRSDTKIIGLTMDRMRVIEAIDKRVDNMIKQGLIDEVERLLQRGYDPTLPALNCIGYKETIDYIKGRISKDKMIDLIKIHTHQFAKRQMTWFKKIKDVTWEIKH
tara:strand:+ start:1143 stop:2030 length:888 start_codon:yes stop_codon:yes gene_type:complete